MNNGGMLPPFLRIAAKPKHTFSDHNGEKVPLQATGPTILLYVQDCKNCEFELEKKAMKLIVDGCKDCVFNINSTLITGMVEVLNCENLAINIQENGVIMTLTIDGSKNVIVNALKNDQFESIYTHHSPGVEVVAGTENPTRLCVDITDEPHRQYLVHWEKEGENVQLICDKVIRDGKYPTTEKKLNEARAREREMSERMANVLVDGIRVKKKFKKSKTKEDGIPKGEPVASTPQPPTPAPRRAPQQPPRPRGAPNIEDEDEKREFFEQSQEKLSTKLDVLSGWLRESKHCIVFTGAGISTSTGIPDFRSGMNTVLKTGPGVWELQAKGACRSAEARVTSVLKAIPSVAHMIIVKLHQEGLVKFTISQNVDGLHLRSGIRADQLAELHGNTNLEKCTKCGAKYLRDFRTRTANHVFDHTTGRLCDNPKCRGHLVDSIINFGENLPEEDLDRAFDEAEKCDLCIVLGSSLRVTPAADIPANVIRKGGKVVICNLQKTPLNDECALELHAQIDDVMVGLAKRLGLEIPQFTVKRRLAVDVTERNITIQGLDVTLDTPYSFLRQVEVRLLQSLDGRDKEMFKVLLTNEPYTMEVPGNVSFSPENPLKGEFLLGFQGHYGEPDFTLRAVLDKPGRIVYLLSYNLSDGTWNVQENSSS